MNPSLKPKCRLKYFHVVDENIFVKLSVSYFRRENQNCMETKLFQKLCSEFFTRENPNCPASLFLIKTE